MMAGRRRNVLLAATPLGALVAVVALSTAAQASAFVTANPDAVQTTRDTAVNFAPAANDTIATGWTLDHVEIESDPSHGVATVNADKTTIHYVPDAGYVGPDSMEYNILVCENPESCHGDTGDIAITVVAPVVTTTTTTTTTVTIVPTTTMTVAPLTTPSTTIAAPLTLPHTGSATGPLTLFGVLAAGTGSMLIALARRRARVAR